MHTGIQAGWQAEARTETVADTYTGRAIHRNISTYNYRQTGIPTEPNIHTYRHTYIHTCRATGIHIQSEKHRGRHT